MLARQAEARLVDDEPRSPWQSARLGDPPPAGHRYASSSAGFGGDALRFDGGASRLTCGGRPTYGARMAGTWWLVRGQLRRRWAAFVPLALIVALGATGTLVAVGAAERTSSAYDRYLQRAEVSDVVLTRHWRRPRSTG